MAIFLVFGVPGYGPPFSSDVIGKPSHRRRGYGLGHKRIRSSQFLVHMLRCGSYVSPCKGLDLEYFFEKVARQIQSYATASDGDPHAHYGRWLVYREARGVG